MPAFFESARSAQFAGFLMSQGFKNIINLAGGVDR